ncbi:tRNA pseudouridine(38-40) synthase TruA [Clostridioides difficile]|uniref:tRNA pseudouridine(38-40) synthase TruA n=1 Tax=Clostridioides difficile TaxID=1496 RepID=UPI000C9C810D|nr:tRNA pseudouridine(38-40) synthase TruA [Clostridioides difficile]EGT3955298.1 tRNA pseudouridine(38-40) synthase TruA [Clostridioides difficile]MDN9167359.1 tRNA pseudouridine(38-40) synthase TruA [Clostridioides difficile]MDN9300604.1 tRNA pseudouridine(38-40) synthase TruA [Clostridioides difficile]MDV9261895.1 tRNA pseudouridine(38-40) synthase TruA [Clostridioides difficile]HBE9271880.1 tRNA pseudouridine(38-40) synthase TruA [Clostridioides difficile]
MRNIKIKIQYNGKNYCGWQKQPDSLGIQGTIERAIYDITKEETSLIGSGRTDSGVHAIGQIANFKINSGISIENIPTALNAKLPKDISVIEACEVNDDFHSRYSAKGKTYKYLVYNSKFRNPILSEISYQVKYELDFDKMCSEAKSLLGTHDFKGFMSSGSSVKDTVRTIYDIDISKKDDLITFEISGNGFLYNMVRIIIGTLVDMGRGRINEPFLDIIQSKTRSRCGHTAPAQGLFLKKVHY